MGELTLRQIMELSKEEYLRLVENSMKDAQEQYISSLNDLESWRTRQVKNIDTYKPKSTEKTK